MSPNTDDVFLGGKLTVLQPAKGYRAGLDAVLLAAAVSAGPGERVLDAGAGVGVVGLCIAARLADVGVTLIERDPGTAALARANVERNRLASRVQVQEADVEGTAAQHASLGLGPASFDHVAANPPYLSTGRARPPPDPVKAAAFAMPAGSLETWARFFARVLRDGGTVTMIHRTDALHDTLTALAGRFGALDVMPVLPRATEAAHRILVRATKGSRRELRLLSPLVLHGAEGNAFLPRLDAILRDGAALDWC